MNPRPHGLGVHLLLVLAVLAGIGMPALRWFHESGHHQARAIIASADTLACEPSDHHDEATCTLCQSLASLRGDVIEPTGADLVCGRCDRLRPWSRSDLDSVALSRIQQVPARGPPSTGC